MALAAAPDDRVGRNVERITRARLMLPDLAVRAEAGHHCLDGNGVETAIASATTQPMSVQPRNRVITQIGAAFRWCRLRAMMPGSSQSAHRPTKSRPPAKVLPGSTPGPPSQVSAT